MRWIPGKNSLKANFLDVILEAKEGVKELQGREKAITDVREYFEKVKQGRTISFVELKI